MSLEKIVAISNKYGANPEFVLAGVGNTSYKDSKYLYITLLTPPRTCTAPNKEYSPPSRPDYI